jgi:N-acetylmuramoyl-L-alanine amidase
MNCIYKLNIHYIISALLFVFLGYFSHLTTAQTIKKKKPFVLVLDAGHGGHDGGCHGAYSNEKDITLQVVLKIKEILAKQNKEVVVVTTRSTDIFWQLEQRGQIANDAKGDLFVSVHVNSSPAKVGTAQGTETFVLGFRDNDKKNAIANSGEVYEGEEEGMLSINDPMTQIMIAQYAQAYLAQSINLGARIETEFSHQGRISKGVKQKSLGVLAHSGMPGVLVEIGFLNNPTEEAYLNSNEGIVEVSQAIVNGILAYKQDIESVKN